MRLLLVSALAVLNFSVSLDPSAGHAPKYARERPISATLIRRAATGVMAPSQTAPAPGTEIDFTWSYAPNLPACTAVLQSCYNGFTMTFTNTGAVIATQSTLGPAALSYRWIPQGGVPYGSLIFTLVTNGYDASGNPVISAPVSVTINNSVISLAPPSVLPGLTGVTVP